jgi:hypothetical protein
MQYDYSIFNAMIREDGIAQSVKHLTTGWTDGGDFISSGVYLSNGYRCLFPRG